MCIIKLIKITYKTLQSFLYERGLHLKIVELPEQLFSLIPKGDLVQ